MDDWVIQIIVTLVILFGVTLFAAAVIMVERRLLALFQERLGPNRVGPFGSLQIVADIIKIFTKEDWVPPFADKFVFIVAPTIIMAAVLMSFTIVSFAPGLGVVDLNVGVLFFLGMSSLGVYSVVLGGWASNSKYSLLGAVRGAAQMISYEVFMGLSLMGVVLLAQSFSVTTIVERQSTIWFCIPQALGMVIFVVAGMAEMRRSPFDLVEAEAELVAGFHSEYSGMKFGMFYVGEYLGLTLMSGMLVTFFFGGWQGPVLPWIGDTASGLLWFVAKTLVAVCFFILVRGSLPRPRYDQVMSLGWKVMLPLALLNLLVTGGVVLALRL